MELWNAGKHPTQTLHLPKFCLSVFFLKLQRLREPIESTSRFHADERTQRYVICSAEDNLIKGAGGQAIQAMNVCQGYEQELGLL